MVSKKNTTKIQWDWDCTPSDTVRQNILKGNSVLLPATQFCHSLDGAVDWVGLRPGRSDIRLERETLQKGGKTFEVRIYSLGSSVNDVTSGWGLNKKVIGRVGHPIYKRGS